MYEFLKSLLLPLLRVPSDPPAPPPGHSDAASLKVFRASPQYLAYRMLGWIIYAVAWGIGVFVVSIALLLSLGPFALILVILLVAFSAVKVAIFYVSTRLDYEMRWYLLTDRSLRVREGVWIVREITLTFANIQNVQVLQGPLQRLFGISDVVVKTAGGGSSPKEQGNDSHRAALRGLDQPEEVSRLILDLLRRYRGAGLGDREDHRTVASQSKGDIDPKSRQVLGEIREVVRSIRAGLEASSP